MFKITHFKLACYCYEIFNFLIMLKQSLTRETFQQAYTIHDVGAPNFVCTFNLAYFLIYASINAINAIHDGNCSWFAECNTLKLMEQCSNATLTVFCFQYLLRNRPTSRAT